MLDIGYGIRLASLLWKYRGKQPSKDLFIFNNNQRFLRVSDFGRLALLIQTGLWNILMKQRKEGIKDASIFVSALQVQFRQTIQWRDQFDIHSRINGWDDKAFYLEQSITLHHNQQVAFSLIARLVPTRQSLVDQLNIGQIESPPLSKSILTFKENHRLHFHSIKSQI